MLDVERGKQEQARSESSGDRRERKKKKRRGDISITTPSYRKGIFDTTLTPPHGPESRREPVGRPPEQARIFQGLPTTQNMTDT
ncbi:hypothetical protein Q5P01_018385 [Channa striata]|uniref:Uncharacterized protein n=1 Tax=Channa striata TaxID=64152 RepID=A0AA88SFV9_CHASR|nr:hypothetical protein Q5P01_018385 [Channa striata]